jgi:hypothetical protein
MLARPLHRWLLLALVLVGTAFSAAARADDTLIGADGMRTGTVEGYESGICGFEGTDVPRASIYYIGLDAELPPPQPQDPMRDEVHLRDGSIHPGPLVSIDADNVAAGSAIHPRKAVAWIWLTPVPPGQEQAAPPRDEPDLPTYEWAGTIKVENRYNGSAGRHVWQGEYRLKFLETPTTTRRPGHETGTHFFVNDVVPVEFEYEIRADHNWDGEGFKVSYGAGNVAGAPVLVSGDVTMAGRAGGRVDGQLLRDSRIVLGSVLRLDAPATTRYDPPDSYASYPTYDEYFGRSGQPTEPGWYEISIGFVGHDMSYNGESLPPYKALSLYRGIRRGGMMPPFVADPDDDLVHWMPEWMPDGTTVIGRLDDPDQSDVRGGFTFPAQGPGSSGDSEQIAVEWSFTRTRQ